MPDARDGPIRIVIVDDHPVVRTGLAGMLASQPRYTVVGEAADGRQALTTIRATRPDVVLMDLRMPQMDGADVIERLRAELPDVNVLVLTTYDTDADILRAVEAGATGYLLKDTPREELFRAIEATATGNSWLTPSIATRLMTRMRTPAEGVRQLPVGPAAEAGDRLTGNCFQGWLAVGLPSTIVFVRTLGVAAIRGNGAEPGAATGDRGWSGPGTTARSATIASAWSRVQCIPAPLSRASITSLLALSTLPLPTGNPAASNAA